MVSGTSSGMGAATAREMVRRGYHVLAGVRRIEDGDPLRVLGAEPVVLDITNPVDLARLATRIDSDPHGRALRAVINNAGMAANAPVETLPLDVWRRVFEVNVIGQIGLTQALLPALHRSGGRVVMISSTGGKIAMPAYGAYSGSKFAIEAVSDALRQELAPHGVQVVVVEPGGVQTDMVNRGTRVAQELLASMTPEQRHRYEPMMHTFVSHSATFAAGGVSADRAAQVIAKAATAPRPRTRYTIGRDAAMLTRLARILPDRALDAAIARTLRPHRPVG
ncbi:MAG: SDR family NAD(P)-dependent oxidoreductase [Cellulomonadaceae bacterium]|nr:SDR family NAD(P)-dependent oxidoreductase [Cellulomonadaceae bacterium]